MTQICANTLMGYLLQLLVLVFMMNAGKVWFVQKTLDCTQGDPLNNSVAHMHDQTNMNKGFFFFFETECDPRES